MMMTEPEFQGNGVSLGINEFSGGYELVTYSNKRHDKVF